MGASGVLTELGNGPAITLLYRCKKRAAWMTENRRAVRRRVLKSAMIEFEGGAFSCAVRNISDSGAALDVPTSVGIPHEFELFVTTDRTERHCCVVWRKATRIGVTFASAAQTR